MPLSEVRRDRVLQRLRSIYGERAAEVLQRVDRLADEHPRTERNFREPPWNERDTFLITYGGQVREEDRPPLRTLGTFLERHDFGRLLSGIHLLPFFPYSSDDGFSVIDYRRVDSDLGDWPDVEALGADYELVFDLVLNHCSAESAWFQHYKTGTSPYDGYFLEADPATDLSDVVRPRSSPLLTPVTTIHGTRHVWTTFSADQVDLNYANPDVLVEMLDVLLTYVARGARILRLDAIAYLWKEVGTDCIHRPPTHDVVKLMRDLLDELAPGTLLLTETNVPHDENVSYFGDHDEAHMVYNFSLAPLLLDAFLARDASPLNAWLSRLEPAEPGTTYFNFTASHDGVGVRPLEGLVEPERFARLVDAVRARDGLVSTKRNRDGTESPYELNVTYFSALDEPGGLPAEVHARRFLSSQAVMLALRGIPGIYFHSLVGTPNDLEGVRQTGRNRTINRRVYRLDELDALLGENSSAQRLVFDGYRNLLAARTTCPAFHPDGPQDVCHAGPGLVAFVRASPDGGQRVLAVCNVTAEDVTLSLPEVAPGNWARDLVSGENVKENAFTLPAFGAAWLAEA